MRTSRYLLATLKEAPADAEIISHRLMLRAGLIRKLAGGIYTWLPTGLRVLCKVAAIVRDEMNRAGAIEISMPAVQPGELWQESGRWSQYGPELLRLKDRHDRDFVIGPTHEEVVTDIVRREVQSYRQLPLHLYQIQTKFRDEIRPRFGVMRGREFLMKDGYSFHADQADLEREYRVMYETYTRICTRLGLRFRAVAADTGAIGGTGSHEFHVLADSGEDAIAYCPDSDYAANVELAEALAPEHARPAARAPLERVSTPGRMRCEDVAAQLGLPLARIVKTIAVMGEEGLALLLLRGDHQLNEIKTRKLTGLRDYQLATAAQIEQHLDAPPGYIGPVGVAASVRIVCDRSVAVMSDFVCGANEAGMHLTGVNFGRDLPEPTIVADLRDVVDGDPSPDGRGKLALCRGIEVGHIFQLRTRYSAALACQYVDEAGHARPMEMGCYGIGVSRIVAAAIEQNHDERGIIWPTAMAPFEVVIVAIGYRRSERVRAQAEALYETLRAQGIDALLDDRDERPGVMFADAELIGIPWRMVVGERALAAGEIEIQGRTDKAAARVPIVEATAWLADRLRTERPTP
ncbi:MAG: Proline--tRNA ligase [Rhodocyclaceae bacterium]|nr:Proline--tRNA ligase [Rhodocyclaceae bacterium]